jgi:hypothetical protein
MSSIISPFLVQSLKKTNSKKSKKPKKKNKKKKNNNNNEILTCLQHAPRYSHLNLIIFPIVPLMIEKTPWQQALTPRFNHVQMWDKNNFDIYI